MFQQSKTRMVIIVILAVISVIVVLTFAYSLINKDNDKDSTEPEKIYRYDLVITEPFDLRLVEVGDEIIIAVVSSEKNPEPTGNVAELALDYDGSILSLTDITTEDGLLSQNHNIDNTLGYATTDIATTEANGFTKGQNLAIFTFELLKTNVETEVGLNRKSTFGVPNQLDFDNSITNLYFTFSDEKPAQEN